MHIERVRTRYLSDVARFCRVDEVERALQQPPQARSAGLRALVAAFTAGAPDRGEAALFAAMVLAADGDDAGLELLRAPQRAFLTNSCIEQGLALVGRALLGDAVITRPFLNMAMVPELGRALGVWPPDAGSG